MGDPSLEYMAGFFDGEGCVSAAIRKRRPAEADRKGPSYILTVSVYNTIKESAMPFQRRFGGSVLANHPERTRPVWRWQIQQQPAGEALRVLIPHLRIKREQAELAIVLCEMMMAYRVSISKLSNTGRKLPVGEQEARTAIVLRLSQMKKEVA